MITNHLLVFAKNPVLGKAKTRLAATIGKEKALEIYKELLEYTCSVAKEISSEKTVYYSDYLEENDLWVKAKFNQKTQTGTDLGSRMLGAFQTEFTAAKKEQSIVLIGTDCKELDSKVIEQAFNALKFTDLVVGPAKDGGYYLIGMKSAHVELFSNVDWSTDAVLEQTIGKANGLKLSYMLLKELSDIDTEADL